MHTLQVFKKKLPLFIFIQGINLHYLYFFENLVCAKSKYPFEHL